jgi:nucleoside-diphosphate-sugar epimerase
MKALVTGGGGFLGRAICEMLRARGDAVRSLARGAYPELAALGVESVRGDVTNAQVVAAACKGCDVVFHVAAKAGIWGRYKDYHQPNVVGTQNVLSACKAQGVHQLVYTSSPSVVFDGRDMENVDESVAYPRHFDAPTPRPRRSLNSSSSPPRAPICELSRFARI